jgi:hypothetical protein
MLPDVEYDVRNLLMNEIMRMMPTSTTSSTWQHVTQIVDQLIMLMSFNAVVIIRAVHVSNAECTVAYAGSSFLGERLITVSL